MNYLDKFKEALENSLRGMSEKDRREVVDYALNSMKESYRNGIEVGKRSPKKADKQISK